MSARHNLILKKHDISKQDNFQKYFSFSQPAEKDFGQKTTSNEILLKKCFNYQTKS